MTYGPVKTGNLQDIALINIGKKRIQAVSVVDADHFGYGQPLSGKALVSQMHSVPNEPDLNVVATNDLFQHQGMFNRPYVISSRSIDA